MSYLSCMLESVLAYIALGLTLSTRRLSGAESRVSCGMGYLAMSLLGGIRSIRVVWSPGLGRAKHERRWQDRVFPGHVSIGPLTIYGANAMHWAITISTRWGYLCLHPTTRTFGGRWPWYVYLSPNATPGNARWGVGPGFDR